MLAWNTLRYVASSLPAQPVAQPATNYFYKYWLADNALVK